MHSRDRSVLDMWSSPHAARAVALPLSLPLSLSLALFLLVRQRCAHVCLWGWMGGSRETSIMPGKVHGTPKAEDLLLLYPCSRNRAVGEQSSRRWQRWNRRRYSSIAAKRGVMARKQDAIGRVWVMIRDGRL